MPDANLPDLNNLEAEVNEIIIPKKFPHITIATVNCNSLNMATVAKHVRLRKFYGIVSLKTDIILLSDIRMCNKAGYCDMNFISKTFSVNPYSSYNFFHHSRTNKRGVGILVKKIYTFYISRAGDRSRRRQLHSAVGFHPRRNGNYWFCLWAQLGQCQFF